MRQLRVLYAAGPGDVVGTFRFWIDGTDDPSVPDVAYSAQFLDVCDEMGAAGWIVGASPRRDTLQAGALRAENRPIPFANRSGVLFHLGRLLYTLGLMSSAIKHRADVMVVSQHGIHWFPLTVLPSLGIRVIPSLHNALWSRTCRPSPAQRALLALARPLFSRGCHAILAHPGTCVAQVNELTSGRSARVLAFLPHYRGAPLTAPRHHTRPFRVMFAGRVEPEKGVFDLLEIARRLSARGRSDIEFDVCGGGSALERLRIEADSSMLTPRFRCHGRLEGQAFRQMFRSCHVVIVPTRSDIDEGFNAVVAEAVLAGRPVVTSRVCPALQLVRDAAVEVPPDDVAAYCDALVALCDDEASYERKCAACLTVREQFLDPAQSWGAALRQALTNPGLSEASVRSMGA